MGSEIRAIELFKKVVIDGDTLSSSEITELRREVPAIEKWRKPLPGSTNIPIIALAALVHNGSGGYDKLKWLLAGEGGWGILGNEAGSYFYSASWSAPVLMTLAEVGYETARQWSLAFFAQHALSTVPFPAKAHVTVNVEAAMRPSAPWGSYRGGMSILPGSRYLWDWPSRRPSVPEIDRSLANPILLYAVNDPRRRWDQWSHASLGWPMQALFGEQGQRYRQRPTLLRDPESAAYLANPSAQTARPLVARLDGFRPRSGRVTTWRYYADGSTVICRNRSTHGTRGPCLVTSYNPDRREAMFATASKPRRAGEWYACSAKLGEDRWESWMNSDTSQRVSGPLPASDVVTEIRWSSSGCRIIGDSVVPPDPPPIDPPPVGPPPIDPPPTGPPPGSSAIDQAIWQTHRIEMEAAKIEPQGGANGSPVGKIGRAARWCRSLLGTV